MRTGSPGKGVGTTARRIRVLPALLVNQIAAGEVVERPASVVKELVDNALDAGGTRVLIELERGGIELVRVTDDGEGIPAEELPLAVAAHATSKVREVEDLSRIGTLGFRGEALASIASVSRLSLRSRQRDSEAAARIDVEGAEASVVRPDAGAPGTSVTVRNLFFNTPARRKFLRTERSEQARCVEVARDLAASHPGVGFTLRADGRTLLDLPAGQSARERAVAVLGEELEGRLLEVSNDETDDARGVVLWGLVGTPEVARPTVKGQHIFINGRPVRDRSLQHALQEAYRGLIEPSRRPTALLLLEMDPASVDVNVHPTKAEVRFRDGGLVFSVVLRAVREALRRADLTPRWSAWGSAGAPPEFGTGAGADRTEAEEFARGLRALAPPSGAGPEWSYEALRAAVERDDAQRAGFARDSWTSAGPGRPGAPEGALPAARLAPSVLQVHNSYIVTQDEQGIVIIDQHALHERVMFEKLMQRLGAGALESQRLLTPALVEAGSGRLEALDAVQPLLARLGVEASPIGPGALAVHAFPSFLFERGVEPAGFLADLLDRAEADGLPADPEDAVREVVDMMACKAAIKAGDHLSEAELSELLALRGGVDRGSNCPHGRPTSIRLSIRDLERQFGRG